MKIEPEEVQEDMDFGPWKCPHCKSTAGVDVCMMVPVYYRACVVNGKAIADANTVDPAYDVAELDAVRCLDCREAIKMEYDYA